MRMTAYRGAYRIRSEAGGDRCIGSRGDPADRDVEADILRLEEAVRRSRHGRAALPEAA